ncbi:MAG: hypothetical protein K2Q01_08055 [Rickettsiales bacterium]|nr:hypothetical protein [Rickettsiales bacterium]
MVDTLDFLRVSGSSLRAFIPEAVSNGTDPLITMFKEVSASRLVSEMSQSISRMESASVSSGTSFVANLTNAVEKSGGPSLG